MHKSMRFSFALLATLIVAGCEWEGANESSDAWNSSYTWVNFDGTYRPPSTRSYLVSQMMPGSGGSTVTTTQQIGTGNGINRTFSGTLANAPVVLGSASVTDGVETLGDVSGSGTFVGTLGGNGTINYTTGALSVTFAFAPPVGARVTVTYVYGTGTSPGPAPGSTQPAYSAVIDQVGQRLTFTLDNGYVFTGQITSMSTAGGDRTGRTDGMVVASYQVTSTTGNIRMTGTLQGTYTAPTDDTILYGSFTDRSINGTWIEPGGTMGDIQGVDHAAVTVSLTPVTY